MTKAKKETISLYKNSGWKSMFAHIRFWEAPLEEIEKLIPKKAIVTELGSGDGILTNFIALSSPSRDVLGVDVDEKRLKEADKKIQNVKFLKKDIRTSSIRKSDTIIISHVLHHLSNYNEQELVLKKSLESLNSNGTLIILEIYVSFSLKYLFGWVLDHFLVPIFFESRIYSPIYYRRKEEWGSLIANLGAKSQIIESVKNKPIANILVLVKH